MSNPCNLLGKLHIPEELRTVLLEFSIRYLIERPSDLVGFAADYFNELNRSRLTPFVKYVPEEVKPEQQEDVDVLELQKSFPVRRKSVYAEPLNLEEEFELDNPVYDKSETERKHLLETIKSILIFRELDNDELHTIVGAMFEVKVKKGDVVIRQGDDGDNFYVIQNGVFNVYKRNLDGEDKLLTTYRDFGSFGELALMYNTPRAATIVAISEGELWALDRKTFKRIVLKGAFSKRKMYNSLIESVPMLQMLKLYERLNLADALEPKVFNDGDLIIKQGDIADGMYFIESGTVKVKILGDNLEEVDINRIETGGYFGELGLITNKPRAASVYAFGKVKLAFLDVDAFERLLGPCMEIMKRNIDGYEQQLENIFGSKHSICDFR